MKEGIDRYTFKLLSKSTRRGTLSDNKFKISRWQEGGDIGVAELPDCPYAEEVRGIESPTRANIAYQSLAVASLKTLRGVLSREREAERLAISLAQGEKLRHLISTLESTSEAIGQTLDIQGRHVLNLSPDYSVTRNAERSWWFALVECIEAIEDGIHCILSLAASQPKGGPGRTLTAIVVRLLRSHHRELLVEADSWIS